MKIYWVIGYNRYYPGRDNFRASFETREQAEDYISNLNPSTEYVYEKYDIIDISDRL